MQEDLVVRKTVVPRLPIPKFETKKSTHLNSLSVKQLNTTES